MGGVGLSPKNKGPAPSQAGRPLCAGSFESGDYASASTTFNDSSMMDTISSASSRVRVRGGAR